VAIPSTLSYGINASGYTGDTPFRFGCYRASAGTLSCSWFSGGLGYDGGEGTPGSAGGAYGWKVKILKQGKTSARVKIWNSLYAIAPDLSGAWTGPTETCQPVLGGTKCKITGTLTISNSGELKAPAMYVNLYLSDDGSYDRGDRLLKQMAAGSVVAGGSIDLAVTYTLPLNQSASGKYVIAVIDPADKIGEVDESNNEAASAVP